MKTRWTWGLIVLVAAGLVLTSPALEAQARRARKAKIKCRLDGEKFKTNTRGGGAGGTYEQPIDELAIVGGRAKYRGRNPATISIDVRTFSMIVLPIDDLATAAFPLVVPVTSAVYSKTITKGFSVVEAKIFEGEGVTMTVTSFDGTRILGTAEGTIPPLEGATEPALVEGCKFSINLAAAP